VNKFSKLKSDFPNRPIASTYRVDYYACEQHSTYTLYNRHSTNYTPSPHSASTTATVGLVGIALFSRNVRPLKRDRVSPQILYCCRREITLIDPLRCFIIQPSHLILYAVAGLSGVQYLPYLMVISLAGRQLIVLFSVASVS
jgi:hypothetical protein